MMNKKWFFVFVPFIVVVLFMSCELFGSPDYVGTWTATVGTASITMEFTKTTFSVTIDTIDPIAEQPVEYVLSGDLDESATAGDLDAIITAVAVNGSVLDAATMAGFFAMFNLTEDETFTYAVTGDSITVSGDLITELTGETSITATRS